MPATDAFGAVRTLARELPFDFGDVEAAGAAYAAWRTNPAPRALRTVQVWAYCYVLRYFTARFAYDTQGDVADADRLVADCYARVLTGLHDVHDPARFPAWVSVVCKNAFRSYLRTRPQRSAPLPDEEGLPGDDEADDFDPTFARLALNHAFGRLPEYLRDVARRRLVDDEPYERLAEAYGKPVAVVRSYVHKAVERLREDPLIQVAAGRD